MRKTTIVTFILLSPVTPLLACAVFALFWPDTYDAVGAAIRAWLANIF